MTKKRNIPGKDVKLKGEYQEYNKAGNPTDRTYTLDENDKFPPTQKKNRSFRKK